MSRPLSGVVTVLRYLLDGWDYCVSNTFDGGDWIQQGGCGKGGDSRPVHQATANSIHRNKYVSYVYRFPSSTAKITDAGRKKAGM